MNTPTEAARERYYRYIDALAAIAMLGEDAEQMHKDIYEEIANAIFLMRQNREGV